MEPHGRPQAAHRELTISGNSRATAAGGACQSVRERCGRKAGTAVAGGARPLVSRVTGSEEGGPKGAVKGVARSEAVAAFSATIAGRAPHRRERVCDSRATVARGRAASGEPDPTVVELLAQLVGSLCGGGASPRQSRHVNTPTIQSFRYQYASQARYRSVLPTARESERPAASAVRPSEGA